MAQQTENAAIDPLAVFGDDGRVITGSWELCHDGPTWEHDFDLTYTTKIT